MSISHAIKHNQSVNPYAHGKPYHRRKLAPIIIVVMLKGSRIKRKRCCHSTLKTIPVPVRLFTSLSPQ